MFFRFLDFVHSNILVVTLIASSVQIIATAFLMWLTNKWSKIIAATPRNIADKNAKSVSVSSAWMQAVNLIASVLLLGGIALAALAAMAALKN